MRKTLIDTTATQASAAANISWLDLDHIAAVEISSEDPDFAIDNALSSSPSKGWRAAAKGPQLIRFNFDKPTSIRRIHLHFAEPAAERCQEFALYARTGTSEMREVVRQQFTFSPGGSTEEVEDYTVDLRAVTALELRIDPDRAHDPTHSQHYAVLQSLRLA